ncbi:MAG: hypothetical protein KatS3mg114_1397 [Planctomycetaceae bacterium]|nr:MAG: hypothetical protein KatS3mg114_1397 [Planctomycetaceae bacterium]
MRDPIIALRDVRRRGQHANLILQRYAAVSTTGPKGDPAEKRQLFDAAIEATKHPQTVKLYKDAYERWKALQFPHEIKFEVKTCNRLIIGLGSENVLETGITLHHTYGLPLLPGSAIKGLAAHYSHQVWGATSADFLRSGAYHALLFGNTDESGCVVFHDGWFVPGSANPPLIRENMTPHHLEWLDGGKLPTDFDSPTPVPFLAVEGRFLLRLSWNGPTASMELVQDWLKITRRLVEGALQDWGIGGKTSSGYGRLQPSSPKPTQVG